MRSNMFSYPFNNSSKKELMLDSLGSFVSYNQSQRMLQNFSKQRNCGRNGMKKSCQRFRPCACKPGKSSKGKGLKGIWNVYRGTVGNSRWTKKWCIESRRLNDEREEGRELRGPFHGRKLSSCWDSARDCLGAGPVMADSTFVYALGDVSVSSSSHPSPGPSSCILVLTGETIQGPVSSRCGARGNPHSHWGQPLWQAFYIRDPIQQQNGAAET